ncbi:MAG: hypothetical protein IH948_02360, partial [Bacteroidetes bacterium]|nr:hypothetical protein [Bacteroidota bacterium]
MASSFNSVSFNHSCCIKASWWGKEYGLSVKFPWNCGVSGCVSP